MKQSLNLKLSQSLTLTPQLKQSLRLLQLSSFDLEHEIQQTLESNPLLERIEPNATNIEESTFSTSDANEAEFNQLEDKEFKTDAEPLDIETNSFNSADVDLHWQDHNTGLRQNPANQSNQLDSENMAFDQSLSADETLYEHLYWQIQMTNLSDKDKLIAKAILRSFDDDGYFNIEHEEVCLMLDSKLEIDTDEVAAVHSLIKTLDPIGVGARDLGERLSLQLANLQTSDTVDSSTLSNAQEIINNHLDLLASRNTSKLKKLLSINDQELSESLALIKTLNPRVTNNFTSDRQDHIIPDLVVVKPGDNKDSQWTVNLNSNNQTKLRVNETYSSLLKSEIDQQGSDFIQKNLIEAKAFIKNIMSRYDTLLLVGQAIVKRQQAFFEHGDQHMQPMVLLDIANELEMHESTISRATAGKYLLSPRGVVELKYFFSSAINTTDGTTSSSTAIRSLIKKMVASESKLKPLSDNKIAQELEQQGHIVARRTVAKYRESMHIAPSSQRKSLL